MSIDVLAVAAHPDDAEVGCGGTLALCVRAGLDVAIVDLTAGESSTAGTRERRAAEAAEASRALGVTGRTCLGLPDGALGTDPAHRLAVVEVLRSLRPRLVLAPWHVTDRHPDHAATGRLVRDAAFLAGVRSLGTGEPHRPDRVYHYMIHHLFEPTFVIDVSSVWGQRDAAVAAYRSQFGGDGGDQVTAIGSSAFLRTVTARAETLGALVGAAYGEGFACEGPLGLGSLPGLDRPRGEVVDYRAHL